MPSWIAIGEAMLEFSLKEGSLYCLNYAGDTLNTTLYIARLQKGLLTPYYLTALGTDTYSDAMLAAWRAEGIDTQLIARKKDSLPGLYLIHTQPSGERVFYYYRSQSAAREMLCPTHVATVTPQCLKANYLYLSLITLAILTPEKQSALLALLQQAKTEGAKLIFDTNYRPRLWPNREAAQHAVQTIVPLTDITFATWDDEAALFSEAKLTTAAQRLHTWGCPEVVVKNGAASAYLLTAHDAEWVPAEVVPQVIDTTSAGDAFNAAYIAARMRGFDPRTATAFGHRLGSAVIQVPGAMIPLANMPALF